MKKNKMMRLASVLLVAVLLTTCSISGTFAKYVTAVEGSDSARVAKWGIGANLGGKDTFESTYTNVVGTDADSSGTPDKVVAPGTTDSGTYILSGAPETAYEVTFNMSETSEVFLKAGTVFEYADSLFSAMNYTVPAEKNYIPMTWNVKLTTTKTPGQVNTSGVAALTKNAAGNDFTNIADMAAAINNTKVAFAANETCDVQIVIAWTWAIDNAAASHINNNADTVLGNLAANTTAFTGTLTANTDYSLTVAYKLTLTATQVD